jgi:hypothetical protein
MLMLLDSLYCFLHLWKYSLPFHYHPWSLLLLFLVHAAILAILVILGGVATLSVTAFTVMSSVVAQMTGDNTTMSGNMTGGNVTGSNTTEASGTISHVCKGVC